MANKAHAPGDTNASMPGGKTGGGIFGGGSAPPPPAPTGKGTSEQQYLKWAKTQGVNTKTAGDIWYWASQYNPGTGDGFAYYWTAVLKRESGASQLNKYGQVTSSGQAVGIGQIALSHIGSRIPWEPAGVSFTNDNNPRTGILSYGVNLRYSAYLLSQAVAQHGYDGAYVSGYNPTDPNRQAAWADIQKTLTTVPASVGPLSPSQGPGQDQGTGKGPTSYKTNPWVVGVTKAGKIVTAPDDGINIPKNTVMYDGAPMHATDFKSLARSLDTYFRSFTGGRPNANIVLQYIQKGWSQYTLTVALSKTKAFPNSPIYKKYAPSYQEVGKDLLGPGQSVPTSLIKAGIINGWDSTTFAAVLRKQPGYVQSNEFKQSTATLSNVHQSIMGIPDANSQDMIQQAAAAGWKPDQYAAWLRSQPQYTSSPEYQTKTLSFLSALGLFTGATPVLKQGLPNPTNPNPADNTALPTDPRLTKALPEDRPEDTVATLNG